MYFELTNNFINAEKWKEIDLDASGFEKKDYHINLNIKMESRNKR